MAQTNELEKKTVAQLKEIAKEMGMAGLSKMKKNDLVAAIKEKTSEAKPASVPEPEVAAETPEPAPEPEAVEEPPAKPVEAEPAAEEDAEEEAPVEAEPAPEVEEVAAEAPEPAPEPEVSEPTPEAPAEAPTELPEVEPVQVKEKKAEKPKAIEKPPTKLQLKTREKYDITAIKKEKKTLKGQIAAAIEAKDSDKVKELRKRKKEIRRILKKAS